MSPTICYNKNEDQTIYYPLLETCWKQWCQHILFILPIPLNFHQLFITISLSNI